MDQLLEDKKLEEERLLKNAEEIAKIEEYVNHEEQQFEMKAQ